MQLLLWLSQFKTHFWSLHSCNTKLFPVPVMDIRGRPGVGFPWFRPLNYSVPDTSSREITQHCWLWVMGKWQRVLIDIFITYLYTWSILINIYLQFHLTKIVLDTELGLKVEHRVIWEKFSSLSFYHRVEIQVSQEILQLVLSLLFLLPLPP